LPCTIFADESGDLGWNFTAPYGQGGSSRHLTIAALCVPPEKSYLPKRIVRGLYTKHNWPTKEERKWSDMSAAARSDFAGQARKMCEENDDIHLHAIVVYKPNVEPHIRADENKLYNYMIRLCLLDRMCGYDAVTFAPDKRSIRVESGRSLHDYLQMEMWFTKKVKTQLQTAPLESHTSKAVQFADMLAGVVQARFERGVMADFQTILPKMTLAKLFFP